MPKNRPWKYRFSHTVSDRSSVLVCGTTPISRLASAGERTTSMPPTVRRARGGDDTRREHSCGGRLAGTVRAEQPEDLAALDDEVEVVDGADVARIDLGEALGDDGRAFPPLDTVGEAVAARVIACSLGGCTGSGRPGGGRTFAHESSWSRQRARPTQNSKSLSRALCMTAASCSVRTARSSSSQRAMTAPIASKCSRPAAVRLQPGRPSVGGVAGAGHDARLLRGDRCGEPAPARRCRSSGRSRSGLRREARRCRC